MTWQVAQATEPSHAPSMPRSCMRAISSRSPAAVMNVIRGMTRPSALALASDRERFAAAAAPGLVRIAELEGGAQPVLDEIHLGAEEVHRRLGVDHHLDPVRLDHLLARPDLAGEIDRVGEPGTARGLDPDPDAGRARADGNAGEIELDQLGLVAHAGHGQTRGVGQPLSAPPEYPGERRQRGDPRLETIAQRAGALPPVRVRHGQLAGAPEADDTRQILGAGTPAPLLTAAAQQDVRFEPIAQDERADPLRPA